MPRLLLIAFALLLAACQAVLVHEVRSKYSHIQVMDYGSRRALVFLGNSTHQAVETLIDLRAPHQLQHPYARTMMVGLLYRPDASAGLLVGLGGGALVRFLNHHRPEMRLDVVEIDPAVVSVAREYFGTEAGPRTRLFIEDGLDYLRRTQERYDVMLMDAHLHPDEKTDRSGQPLHLRTAAFLGSLHERLTAGGVVLFNMIEGPDTATYINAIRAAYAAVDVFRPAGSGNVVVVAAPTGFRRDEAALVAQARLLDRQGGYGFSFERLLDERRR